MKRFSSKLLAVFALLMLLTGSVVAGEINDKAGTSAFSFLKINVGARAVAMGTAFTGLADDESALYYNPAGIASFEYDRYLLGYHSYFVGMQSGIVGYIHPLDYTSVIGLYISYLNYGEMDEADGNGNLTGQTFGGGDMLIGLAYARNISRTFQIGLTSKFIYEKIENYSATGLAFDIGARLSDDRDRYKIGVVAQNIGTQLSSLGQAKSDPLPLTIRVGVSAKPRVMNIILAGDVIIPRDNDVDFALGAEYYHLDPFLIRLGWNSFGSNYTTSAKDDTWAGLSFGVGMIMKNLGAFGKAQLSYSYTPAADLGNSHRITITGGR